MDYSKLRGRIVEKYGTQKAFFSHLSITSVQASKKINGKTGFSQKDIIEWCGLLDINLEDIGSYFYAQKVGQGITIGG
jgi:hypothetical protein